MSSQIHKEAGAYVRVGSELSFIRVSWGTGRIRVALSRKGSRRAGNGQ
jgi:hypothetical protein